MSNTFKFVSFSKKNAKQNISFVENSLKKMYRIFGVPSYSKGHEGQISAYVILGLDYDPEVCPDGHLYGKEYWGSRIEMTQDEFVRSEDWDGCK